MLCELLLKILFDKKAIIFLIGTSLTRALQLQLASIVRLIQ